MCLIRQAGEEALEPIGWSGVSAAVASEFTIAAEDWENPLRALMRTRRGVYYPALHTGAERRRRRKRQDECPCRRANPILERLQSGRVVFMQALPQLVD